MRPTQPSNIFIAPLRIHRNSSDDGPSALYNESSPTATLTSETIDDQVLSHARFHNYLRALYTFQPSPHSSTTVTLPLNAGDIILVHSVHVNGWADGTLLETGARGWLPTNYCEAYDHASMRPLLKALTEFWDIVRCGSDYNLNLFRNQDYMRGLVAGVRALLERSDCLTRDAPLVRRHEAIRRSRKSLLSDLALLVRTAKQLQQVVTVPSSHKDLDIRLDDMLLKAFRIVTRAVFFFDVWTEQISAIVSSPTRSEVSHVDSSGPPTSPRSRRPQSTIMLRNSTPTASNVASRRNSAGPVAHNTPVRRQSSTTHRMSYTRGTNQKNSNLISQYLHKSYDDFLTVLASFLGSHMQSRSSSELLMTTQNAVRSCRQLFAIVETVIERDYSTSRPLIQAKDAMYYAITELVHAARQVFKPIHSMDDELVYLPEEAQNLVRAATACVSAAGRCVARTKATLEEIGDFEVENIAQLVGRGSDSSSTLESTSQEVRSSAVLRSSIQPATVEDSSRRVTENAQIPIPRRMITPPLPRDTSEAPLTSFTTAAAPQPRDDVIVDIIRSSPVPEAASLYPNAHRRAPGITQPPIDKRNRTSVMLPMVESKGSDSSLDTTNRRSDPSNLSSASTRVASLYGGGSFTDSLSAQSTPDDHSSLGDDDDDVEAEIMTHTFAQEIIFNREGVVVGGTLNALVERLTAHDSTPDVSFISTIYLTFRLFARPEEFASALALRFDYVAENPRITNPVRLRVYNVLKGWMESHWRHDCDDTALPVIVGFARESMMPVLPMAGNRILELAEQVSSANKPIVPRVISAMGKTSTSSATYVDPNTPLPTPVLSKSQLSALKTWKMGGATVSILDFDPLELARQITLKTSKIFCSILPEELLGTEWTKRSSSLAVNVRAMSTLSTDISNLVSDSILQLEEPKRRAAIVKQWVKIANKCLDLHNYDTLMAIVCALDSTNIKRMRKTWEGVPQKTRSMFDELCKVVDVAKNYSALRQRVQSHLPPCLPFIGVYLTDLTMVDTAYTNTRPLTTDQGRISVINLDKHMNTAKIISDLQRFQVPYRFAEISELQTWMQDQLVRVRSAGDKSFQMHYRRSLILEPREPNRSPNPDMPQSAKEKDKFDFLNWTHLLQKDKPAPIQS